MNLKNKTKNTPRHTNGNLLESSTLENVILHSLFILLTIIFLYPVLLVIGTSFAESESLIKEGYRMIPKVWSLEAYKVAAGSADIFTAYKNTIFATVVGTFLSVTITLLYAFPLSRKNYKHRTFFSFYIYLPTLFGGGMIPWYIVCTKFLHINNTYFALFLPSLISAWNVIVLRTFITANIPDEIIEAARIDGCSNFKIFSKIIVPLSVAGTATIALFVALGFWNDYYLPMMLITEEKYYNLQYYLQLIFFNIEALKNNEAFANASTARVPSETVRFAMCCLAMGPILIVYPFFQKYFVKGLTVGSVKG